MLKNAMYSLYDTNNKSLYDVFRYTCNITLVKMCTFKMYWLHCLLVLIINVEIYTDHGR